VQGRALPGRGAGAPHKVSSAITRAMFTGPICGDVFAVAKVGMG
jgi:hypothetical protein